MVINLTPLRPGNLPPPTFTSAPAEPDGVSDDDFDADFSLSASTHSNASSEPRSLNDVLKVIELGFTAIAIRDENFIGRLDVLQSTLTRFVAEVKPDAAVAPASPLSSRIQELIAEQNMASGWPPVKREPLVVTAALSRLRNAVAVFESETSPLRTCLKSSAAASETGASPQEDNTTEVAPRDSTPATPGTVAHVESPPPSPSPVRATPALASAVKAEGEDGEEGDVFFPSSFVEHAVIVGTPSESQDQAVEAVDYSDMPPLVSLESSLVQTEIPVIISSWTNKPVELPTLPAQALRNDEDVSSASTPPSVPTLDPSASAYVYDDVVASTDASPTKSVKQPAQAVSSPLLAYSPLSATINETQGLEVNACEKATRRRFENVRQDLRKQKGSTKFIPKKKASAVAAEVEQKEKVVKVEPVGKAEQEAIDPEVAVTVDSAASLAVDLQQRSLALDARTAFLQQREVAVRATEVKLLSAPSAELVEAREIAYDVRDRTLTLRESVLIEAERQLDVDRASFEREKEAHNQERQEWMLSHPGPPRLGSRESWNSYNAFVGAPPTPPSCKTGRERGALTPEETFRMFRRGLIAERFPLLPGESRSDGESMLERIE